MKGITVHHPDPGDLVIGMRGRCKPKDFQAHGPFWDSAKLFEDKWYAFSVRDNDGLPWVHFAQAGSPRRSFWSCNPQFFRAKFEYEVKSKA